MIRSSTWRARRRGAWLLRELRGGASRGRFDIIEGPRRPCLIGVSNWRYYDCFSACCAPSDQGSTPTSKDGSTQVASARTLLREFLSFSASSDFGWCEGRHIRSTDQKLTRPSEAEHPLRSRRFCMAHNDRGVKCQRRAVARYHFRDDADESLSPSTTKSRIVAYGESPRLDLKGCLRSEETLGRSGRLSFRVRLGGDTSSGRLGRLNIPCPLFVLNSAAASPIAI